MNDTYNGWSNWATWNVALWLGNDEALYLDAKDMRSAALTEAGAEELVRNLLPDGTPDMDSADEYADVNWTEVRDCIAEL